MRCPACGSDVRRDGHHAICENPRCMVAEIPVFVIPEGLGPEGFREDDDDKTSPDINGSMRPSVGE